MSYLSCLTSQGAKCPSSCRHLQQHVRSRYSVPTPIYLFYLFYMILHLLCLQSAAFRRFPLRDIGTRPLVLGGQVNCVNCVTHTRYLSYTSYGDAAADVALIIVLFSPQTPVSSLVAESSCYEVECSDHSVVLHQAYHTSQAVLSFSDLHSTRPTSVMIYC
ncbi:hypothetical protein EJ05DRAFT_188180 [Pseudovirgaria hyperparasitica]|uniref:Uncharacterized protein n=1 Tax=Pseudovirgaria hyperparasitica TaxID=470096 RepID=A0A6A6WJD8_9PEZI|nr:uncharacterized protein EJ05DRAFT_188180 [Pseudovirgaria hyperparasitica]KAF2761887.1 hypothetical protein EJ05DRAFT_188180 [Pseudovirgaria hyperparasitica]